MTINFYDQTGEPYLQVTDSGTIFLMTGEAIAYIEGDIVYSFRGKHLAFFENGLFWDKTGAALLFSEGSEGGPKKPRIRFEAMPMPKKPVPHKNPKKHQYEKPEFLNHWSRKSPEHIFQRRSI